MHKDEVWQVYAPNGEAIAGEGWDSALDNPEKNESNKIVGVAVVFLFRRSQDGELELLWQRRSNEIDRYPGDYDISAGGHINLNESIIDAAIREAREEIGAMISPDELRFVTMSPFNANRFAWIYAVDWTGKTCDFHFDDHEVSEVKWVPFSQNAEFVKKYAKKPLKDDKITFEVLKHWFEISEYIDHDREETNQEGQEIFSNNYAFIDGQNLQLGTVNSETPWRVDLKKFRIYLREKYNVDTAYYFVGAYDSRHDSLYYALQKSGFLVMFREHSAKLTSKKKGNVDTDIVFEMMKSLIEKENFNKIVLVSGDGDYMKVVDYLIRKNRFGKLLAPSKKGMSSLYRGRLPDSIVGFLDAAGVKKKIAREEENDIQKAGSP